MRPTVLLYFLWSAAWVIPIGASPADLPKVCFKDVCVDVEVVSTKADLMRGLSGRALLREGQGMLFVFDKVGSYEFWMKDMQFALDILWLDSKGAIVHYVENVPPCTSKDCPRYKSDQPAQMVLELKAGFVKTHHIDQALSVQLPPQL